LVRGGALAVKLAPNVGLEASKYSIEGGPVGTCHGQASNLRPRMSRGSRKLPLIIVKHVFCGLRNFGNRSDGLNRAV